MKSSPANVRKLREDRGLTYTEMAEVLGVSVSTARTWYLNVLAGLPMRGAKRGRKPRRTGYVVCKARGCSEAVDTSRGGARGMCPRHYQRWRRRSNRNS